MCPRLRNEQLMPLYLIYIEDYCDRSSVYYPIVGYTQWGIPDL